MTTCEKCKGEGMIYEKRMGLWSMCSCQLSSSIAKKAIEETSSNEPAEKTETKAIRKGWPKGKARGKISDKTTSA